MIEVERLTRRYGDTVAVADLSFGVGRGEVVGFLGPNGAGKTTTMRIVAGSLGATSGTVRVGGHDVALEPRAARRVVGYLPEVPPLYGEMTVQGYVRFVAAIKGVSDPSAATRAALDRTGLAEVSHRVLDHLSKGYRQRVGLAQALVHDPDILVLDEPTSGLDPAQRVEIRELLRRLAGENRTIILSTHVLAEVEALCERVIIVDRGRLVADERMDAITAGTATEIRLLRAGPEAERALGAVGGVGPVHSLGDGRYRVEAALDRRAELAAAAVPFGLVELTAHRPLESIYLSLTIGGEA